MPSIKRKICNRCKAIVSLPHNCRDTTNDKMYNKTKRINNDFYNSQPWRKKRELILNRDSGLCQECLRNGITTIGNIVHHIIELNDDWNLRLVDDNLEVICQRCHNKQHKDK